MHCEASAINQIEALLLVYRLDMRLSAWYRNLMPLFSSFV